MNTTGQCPRITDEHARGCRLRQRVYIGRPGFPRRDSVEEVVAVSGDRGAAVNGQIAG